MSLQYVGLNEINGPLVVLDHVKGASYDEMVDIQLKDGTTRAGRIVQIEGEKVVVIDDLISTGGSVLNAVHAVENEGAEVIGVVSIFTYQNKVIR